MRVDQRPLAIRRVRARSGWGTWRSSTSLRLAVLFTTLGVLLTSCSSGGSRAGSAPALITSSYKTLFNLADKSVAPKLAVVQDGASISKAMNQALASPVSSSAGGARIDKAAVLSSAACRSLSLSAPCAKVTYDIMGTSGGALLSSQTGYAVYLSGTWLVAKTTICKLFDLFYEAEGQSGKPAGC